MQNKKPYFALIALCFLWGTTYLAIKIGVEYFPPFLFSGIRFVIAGGLITLVYAFQKNSIWPTFTEVKRLFFSGSLIFIGGNLFLVIAEKTIPSGLAALINTAFPLWMLIITRIWNPTEKTPIMALVGILIGLAGQFVIFYDQLFLLNNSTYFGGIILCVLGVMNGAVGSIHMKKFPVATSPVLTGGLQMLICGTITTIIGLFQGELSQLNAEPSGWLSMLYLIVAGSILGYSLFVYALQHLPAAMVSIYAYVNPIVALWLGSLLLQESISPRTVIAMTVTLVGVFIVNRGMQLSRKKQL